MFLKIYYYLCYRTYYFIFAIQLFGYFPCLIFFSNSNSTLLKNKNKKLKKKERIFLKIIDQWTIDQVQTSQVEFDIILNFLSLNFVTRKHIK